MEFGQYKEFKNLDELHNFIGINKKPNNQSKSIERNSLVFSKGNLENTFNKNNNFDQISKF